MLLKWIEVSDNSKKITHTLTFLLRVVLLTTMYSGIYTSVNPITSE